MGTQNGGEELRGLVLLVGQLGVGVNVATPAEDLVAVGAHPCLNLGGDRHGVVLSSYRFCACREGTRGPGRLSAEVYN